MSERWAAFRAVVAENGFGILAGISAAVIYTALFASNIDGIPGRSDSYYTYLISRSIAFDFDLDFTNDYEICGDPQRHAYDLGTGRPTNFFYTGTAFVLAPLIALGRLVVPLGAAATAAELAACRGPILVFALSFIPLMGGVTVFLSYRVARRFADDFDAGLSASLFALTTPLIAYAASMPAASHAYAAFFTALLVITAYRAFEKPDSWIRWVIAGAVVVPNTLTRPPGLAYALVPCVLALCGWRRVGRPRATAAALVVSGFGAAALGAQLLINKYLYNGYLVSSTGRHYFQPLDAHPLLLLFGIKGGFFYHTPTAYVAAVGCFVLFKRYRQRWPLYAPLLVVAVLQVLIYSANIGWHAFGTFGARKLTHFVPMLTLAAAPAISAARSWLGATPQRWSRMLAVLLLVPVAFTYVGATYGLNRRKISLNTHENQAGFFGEGVKQAWVFFDREVGPLAVLPAAAVFALRYGLPMNRLGDATAPQRWYTRITRGTSLKFKKNSLRLADRRLLRTVVGGRRTKSGLRIPSGEVARIVFTAEWPYLTHLTVLGSSKGDCRVALTRAGFFGSTDYGEAAVTKRAPGTFLVPDGGFGSGVNELTLRVRGGGCESVIIEKIDLEDRTERPLPFDNQKRWTPVRNAE